VSGRACRACGAAAPTPVLDLGRTPLANALLDEADLAAPEPTYPLVLAFCEACALLQLEHVVEPERLFRHYVYFSSFSDTMVRHAEVLAARLATARGLGPGSLVMEAASNDGYLLRHYVARGVPVLGIDPARNVAREAEARGVPTLPEFFGRATAARLVAEGRRADVFHAHNVLGHVPDLDGFVAGIAAVLKPDGVAILEFPYAKDMLDHGEYDTIYHEHLSYFTLTPLAALFGRHGLVVREAERIPLHGGSLQLEVGPGGEPGPEVRALLAEEAAWGVRDVAVYARFADRVAGIQRDLRALLADLKARGGRIAVYGASAKGATLLNTCRLGRETLDYVVDRSTVKQGLYTPGTRLEIFPPEKLLEDRPDYALLLTWNFAEEILAQQAAYRAGGGRFIVPIPHVHVV
jgi:SAM-dependent methyltransferase